MVLTTFNVSLLTDEMLRSSTALLRKSSCDHDAASQWNTVGSSSLPHVVAVPFSQKRLGEPPNKAHDESLAVITVENPPTELLSTENAAEESSATAEPREAAIAVLILESNAPPESNRVLLTAPLEPQLPDTPINESVVSTPNVDLESKYGGTGFSEFRTETEAAAQPPPSEPLLNLQTSDSNQTTQASPEVPTEPVVDAESSDSLQALESVSVVALLESLQANESNTIHAETTAETLRESINLTHAQSMNNETQWDDVRIEPVDTPKEPQLHPESSDSTVESSPRQINVLPRPMLRLMDLDRYLKFPHRGGWTSIINGLNASEYLSLSPPSAEEAPSVGLVDFVESWFVWDNRGAIEQQPWVGFAHLMLRSALPSHLQDSDHNGVLDFTFETETFRRSASQCLALMVFTTAMAVQTSQKLGELGLDHIPVCVVTHPMGVESNVATYDPTVDLAAALSITSSVVLLGQQYRRMASLHQLQTQRTKVWLPSFSDPNLLHWLRIKTDMELKAENVTMDDTVEIRRLESNDDYDMFVRQNIVIVDLWAAGANNAVMESLALQAPFLIRKLDGPVEYLGEDYPLFFSHLDEVQYWLDNEDVLREKMLEAHRYLQQLDTSGYTIEHFGEQMVNCTMAAMNGSSMRLAVE
jgi:hypothetical protein